MCFLFFVNHRKALYQILGNIKISPDPIICFLFFTTRLYVATKMIIQILPYSWILRVACNTVDPYTLPASHHIFFRINGIIKCDRNIKYSRAALGSNFEIRVVSDGPRESVMHQRSFNKHRGTFLRVQNSDELKLSIVAQFHSTCVLDGP